MVALIIGSTKHPYYLLKNGLVKYKGRIYVGNQGTWRQKFVEVILTHQHLDGHSSISNTYQSLNQLFF